ncbi:MAG: CRTAC1 family protein [Planctomycetaceae bacterium]|nr:CRTAC1 family protein [Planctomycetaceae bacterium]
MILRNEQPDHWDGGKSGRTPCPLWLVAAATLVYSCGGSTTIDPQSDQPVDSHQRMVRTLQRIQADSVFENPYFQTNSLELAERQLKRLNGAGDPRVRFDLHLSLANDYRRLGKPREAVHHFQEAKSAMEQSGAAILPDQLAQYHYQLGVTWLRVAEDENCLNCLTGQSCLFPIQQEGIHQHPSGSREAIRSFQNVLELHPEHIEARWLLNVAAMTLGEFPDGVPEEYRLPSVHLHDSPDFPAFLNVAREAGVATLSCSGGVVAEDFDNDGRIDVLTSTWDPNGQIRFLHNRGDGTFEDQTQSAGLIGILGGINMVQGDFNNDGQIDVYVVRGAWLGEAGRNAINSLLQNVGGGRFRDMTYEVGLSENTASTATAAWGDYDNDGDLDLYVPNEDGTAQLYRNDRGRRFIDVAIEAGVTNRRFAKGAVWGDIDNDRDLDLYVSNLGDPNRMYVNQGNGTFEDVADELQVAEPLSSFPCWFWDVNNDGRLDLYVASYDFQLTDFAKEQFGMRSSMERDRLYLGTDAGGFQDQTELLGLTEVTLPMGANFGDLDNDGFPDFYLGTGYPSYEALMPNKMYWNREGRSFVDVTTSGRFGHLQKGHGVAFADFDNDGDQDVFIQTGGAYPGDAFTDVLFENPGMAGNWLKLDLVGRQSNRFGVGARIRLEFADGGTLRTVTHQVSSGGSFGANSLRPHIGVGQAEKIDRLTIEWPTSGQSQVFRGLEVNQRFQVIEGASPK